MKFTTFLFPAFVATALASPVQQRDTSSLSSIISTLQTSVLAHDASLSTCSRINLHLTILTILACTDKTSASLSPSSSKEDKAAAVAATDADIKAITASLRTAQSSVKSLKAEQKRDTSAEQTQQMNAIYQDILYTMTNVPKDTLGKSISVFFRQHGY